MHVIHNIVLVGGDLLPLEVVHVHLLAAAIVYTSEHVDVVSEVECRVKEASVRHWAQFDELHRLKVQHHSILCTGGVVVTAENDDLVARDECRRLSLYRQWELDWQYTPLVAGDVILLYAVNPPAALITSEAKDVAVFKDNGRAGASPLVQVCDALPPIHIDRVPFAGLKDTIDASTADSIYEVSLMRQGVSISALV